MDRHAYNHNTSILSRKEKKISVAPCHHALSFIFLFIQQPHPTLVILTVVQCCVLLSTCIELNSTYTESCSFPYLPYSRHCSSRCRVRTLSLFSFCLLSLVLCMLSLLSYCNITSHSVNTQLVVLLC